MSLPSLNGTRAMNKQLYNKIIHLSQCLAYWAFNSYSNQRTPLWALAAHYKLDKLSSSGYHNYIPVYENLFRGVKKNIYTVVEIGIGVTESGQMAHVTKNGYKTGNSLRCWRDFFPNAQIIGIDIYKADLHEERITTFVGDQTDENSMKNIIHSLNKKIDIIIDDGTHRYEDQLNNFVWLHTYLNESGLYIIEDVDHKCISKFESLSDLTPAENVTIQKTFRTKIIKDYTRNNNCLVVFEKILSSTIETK